MSSVLERVYSIAEKDSHLIWATDHLYLGTEAYRELVLELCAMPSVGAAQHNGGFVALQIYIPQLGHQVPVHPDVTIAPDHITFGQHSNGIDRAIARLYPPKDSE